jgi:hypothetical protein
VLRQCRAGIVLVDPRIELQRGAAEDSVVAADGREHQRALRAAR